MIADCLGAYQACVRTPRFAAHGCFGQRSQTFGRAVKRGKIITALAAEFTLAAAVRLCGLRALCGVLRRGFTTARRSRNQTCTYRTLAGIVGEGNISARLATNLGISSTEGTESTEKSVECLETQHNGNERLTRSRLASGTDEPLCR